MMQANADPLCRDRVVPACWREHHVGDPAICPVDHQYCAEPSRRFIEVARRFDPAPLCNRAHCHNGIFGSVCAADYAPVVGQIAAHILARRTERCLPAGLRSDSTSGPNESFINLALGVLVPPGIAARVGLVAQDGGFPRPSPRCARHASSLWYRPRHDRARKEATMTTAIVLTLCVAPPSFA